MRIQTSEVNAVIEDHSYRELNSSNIIFETDEPYEVADLLAQAAVYLKQNPELTLIGMWHSYHDDGTDLILTVE